MLRQVGFCFENAVAQLASSGLDVYISPPAAWVNERAGGYIQWAFYSTRATARMAKLVDAWDLKSPVREDVPVRFRLRAPNKSRACTLSACRPFVFLLRNFGSCSAIPDSTNFYQAGKSEKRIAESTQATQQPMTEKKAP